MLHNKRYFNPIIINNEYIYTTINSLLEEIGLDITLLDDLIEKDINNKRQFDSDHRLGIIKNSGIEIQYCTSYSQVECSSYDDNIGIVATSSKEDEGLYPLTSLIHIGTKIGTEFINIIIQGTRTHLEVISGKSGESKIYNFVLDEENKKIRIEEQITKVENIKVNNHKRQQTKAKQY